MTDESSTAVAEPRTALPPGSGAGADDSDVERSRESAPPAIADLAPAATGTVAAAVAFATIHDDRDVGIVFVALDQAGVHLFAELGRHD